MAAIRHTRLRSLAGGLGAAAVLLLAGGCTRGYDGSVVPAYKPVMVQDRLLGHVELRRNRPAPPPPRQVERFPPVPPLVAGEPPRRRPPPPHGARSEPPPSAHPLRCGPRQDAGGRTRVICE